MRNEKKLLVVLLLIVLMLGVCGVAFATEADQNVTFIQDEGADNNTVNNNITNNTTNNTTNTNTTNNINNTNNTNTTNNTNNTNTTNNTNNANSSQYNNTNLPKAGVTDNISIMIVIAIFGILALYAYKKIRDYNLK